MLHVAIEVGARDLTVPILFHWDRTLVCGLIRYCITLSRDHFSSCLSTFFAFLQCVGFDPGDAAVKANCVKSTLSLASRRGEMPV